MKNISVRRITGVGILLAIELILQLIGNFLAIGPVSINLSLIPIAVAAIVYGPIAGAFLGLANGAFVLFAPSTQIFWQTSPWGTPIVCLFKCTLAGLISGLVYKLIARKNPNVGAMIASILVPIINTGLFSVGCFTLISPTIAVLNGDGIPTVTYVFILLIGWNFIFELGTMILLSPAINKIRIIMTRSDKHAL